MSGLNAKKQNNTESVLDDSAIDPKNHKVRITTFIDGDLLLWLRAEAEKMNLGYQTVLSLKLREAMIEAISKPSILERVFGESMSKEQTDVIVEVLRKSRGKHGIVRKRRKSNPAFLAPKVLGKPNKRDNR